MAEPFADEAYYAEHFGTPPAKITDRLDAELARASRFVRAECPGVDERIADEELDPDVAADVVCEMVKAAASSPAEVGVTQAQQTSGPYSQSMTFANPTGDLYLTKSQRRRLGCGGQRAASIPMGPSAAVVHPLWCDVWLELPCTCGAVA